MISTDFYLDLPVGEKLKLHKNRWEPRESIKNPKRISIISGIHGDELEGQYVCFLLADWLNKHPDRISGIVDIYPAVNSLGIDSIERSFPFYDVDLNRNFPGSSTSYLPAQLTNAIVESVRGSDIAIDIHSSNIFLKEIPQVRISQENAEQLEPIAEQLNIDFVWIHDAVTVLQSTLSHSLNTAGTATLVVEMGVGMRVTQPYGRQLVDGILNLMQNEGIITGEDPYQIRQPISTDHGQVHYINADESGIFIPSRGHCMMVKKKEKIGEIVDPLTGKIRQKITSPAAGLLFTLRAYPVVYEGSLIARIFEDFQ